MAGFSSVTLVGRMVEDPELRTTSSGRSVVSFTLAFDGRMKNPDGKGMASCFITCVAFGQTAENMAKSTKKGSNLGVIGTLNQRKFKRKDDSIGSVIEVLCDTVKFLDPKEKGKGGFEQIPPYDDAPIDAPEDSDESRNLDAIDLPDDDLPF